jgi:hypothetical protein
MFGALGDAVSSYGTCRDRSPGSSTTTPGSSSRPRWGAGRAPSLGRLRKLAGNVHEFRVTVAFGLVLAAEQAAVSGRAVAAVGKQQS